MSVELRAYYGTCATLHVPSTYTWHVGTLAPVWHQGRSQLLNTGLPRGPFEAHTGGFHVHKCVWVQRLASIEAHVPQKRVLQTCVYVHRLS